MEKKEESDCSDTEMGQQDRRGSPQLRAGDADRALGTPVHH